MRNLISKLEEKRLPTFNVSDATGRFKAGKAKVTISTKPSKRTFIDGPDWENQSTVEQGKVRGILINRPTATPKGVSYIKVSKVEQHGKNQTLYAEFI